MPFVLCLAPAKTMSSNQVTITITADTKCCICHGVDLEFTRLNTIFQGNCAGVICQICVVDSRFRNRTRNCPYCRAPSLLPVITTPPTPPASDDEADDSAASYEFSVSTLVQMTQHVQRLRLQAYQALSDRLNVFEAKEASSHEQAEFLQHNITLQRLRLQANQGLSARLDVSEAKEASSHEYVEFLQHNIAQSEARLAVLNTELEDTERKRAHIHQARADMGRARAILMGPMTPPESSDESATEVPGSDSDTDSSIPTELPSVEDLTATIRRHRRARGRRPRQQSRRSRSPIWALNQVIDPSDALNLDGARPEDADPDNSASATFGGVSDTSDEGWPANIGELAALPN